MLTKPAAYPKTLSFFLGWLAVAALPPFYIFPALFVSLPGILLLIQDAPCSRAAFGRGYAFGFAFFAFGLSWIGNALLIDAAVFGWLYPLALLACGFFFGLFIAVPAWLSWYFKPLCAKYFAFPALWVLFEWLRSFVLTGFPWNLLGTVLAFDDRLIQFAAVGGTYALSLAVLFITAAPAFYIHNRTRRTLAAALAIILSGPVFLYAFGAFRIHNHPLDESDIKIRIVQPDIPQKVKWRDDVLETNFAKYIALSQTPGQEDIDFTVWGETASPFPLDLDAVHLRQLLPAVPPQGYLVTGLVRYQFDRISRYIPYNSMFVIDRDGNIPAYYDKSHLVPFGEYIPLRDYLPDWIRPVANVIGTFRSGSGPQRIELPGYPSFGGLICYEIIFPHQIVAPRNRPAWIINLTNDGWYGDSAGPRQHLVAARLRAVEEGISIIRAANTGISAVITPLGIVSASLGLNQTGVLDTFLPQPADFSTTYGKYGNTLTLIWCLCNLLLAFCLTFRTLHIKNYFNRDTHSEN